MSKIIILPFHLWIKEFLNSAIIYPLFDRLEWSQQRPYYFSNVLELEGFARWHRRCVFEESKFAVNMEFNTFTVNELCIQNKHQNYLLQGGLRYLNELGN